jgi:uncharacterized protein (TIGR02599 family)
MNFNSHGSRNSKAFSLMELLVSMTVLALLMLLVVQVLGSAQRSWRMVSSKVSQFREARQAFNRMVFALSQATLNTYSVQIYQGSSDPLVPPSKNMRAAPNGYARYSELQFICGPSAGSTPLTGLSAQNSPGHAVFFQAPLGTSANYRLPGGLNGSGFFVNFSDDASYRPDFLEARNQKATARYRLWEFRTPVENNSIYNYSVGNSQPRQVQSLWYDSPMPKSRPVADNIVLLIVSPRLAEQDVVSGNSSTSQASAQAVQIAPNYFYNSVPTAAITLPQKEWEHQLPPLVDLTMVAIDSATAEKLADSTESDEPPLSEILTPDLFVKAQDRVRNLRELEAKFIKKKINYRVFSTTVVIRASKWGAGT